MTETTEKRKNDMASVSLFRFMRDWVVYSILAFPAGGVIGGVIAVGISMLVVPLYTWRYGELPQNDDGFIILVPLIIAGVSICVTNITFMLTLLQRWTVQNHFPVALMIRSLIWAIFIGMIPGFILFVLFYVDKTLVASSFIIFNSLITLPILTFTIFQWRWLRGYVQRAELWLLVHGGGVLLANIGWQVPYSLRDYWMVGCTIITLLASGYVMYRLFTQHNLSEKIKQKPKIE